MTQPDKIDSAFLWRLVFILVIEKLLLLAYIYRPLPEKAYFSPQIWLEAFTKPQSFIILSCAFIPPLLTWKRARWSTFELSNPLRWLIFGVAAIIAWKYAFYPYNYYYNQSHLIDRSLVILLSLLILVHPAFVAPFLFIAGAVINQFYFPLLTQSWTEKLPLIEILVIFNACLLIKIFSKRIQTNFFLLLALSLIGANYFSAGMKKLDLSPHGYEWFIFNKMSFLSFQSYKRGLLDFLNADWIPPLIEIIRRMDRPLQAAAIFLELLGITLLWNRRTTLVSLLLLSTLNILIFLVSGLLFWEWILTNFFFFLFIWRLPATFQPRLYRTSFFILSLLLVLGGRIAFKPVQLGWYDSNITNYLTFEVQNNQGDVRKLDSSVMSLYDYTIDNAQFCFLMDERLVSCRGTTQDLGFAKEAYQLHLEELSNFKETKGMNQFNQAKKQKLEEFLRIYFYNFNQRKKESIPFAKFSAPRHIPRRFFSTPQWNNEWQHVNSVRIRFTEHFYGLHTKDLVTTRDEIINQVEMP